MEFIFEIAILLILLFFVTAHTAHASATNQYVIERKRREYLYARELMRRTPYNQAYQRLAHTLGMAYAAIEDATIFDETLLAQDLAHHYDVNARSHSHSTVHFASDTTHPSREFIRE